MTKPSNFNVQSVSDTDESLVHVMQGQLRATPEANVVLTTILGSCVSTCLYDSKAKIGGMNHFLLPESSTSNFGSNRYGAYAMELLINELMKLGAQKRHLIAKVFGGADMLSNELAVGKRNGRFALGFLKEEGIPCVSTSLGGQQARRIRFWPQTGDAKLKFIDNDQSLFRNIAPDQHIKKTIEEIELF